MAKYNA
jgi:hypothetical protein